MSTENESPAEGQSAGDNSTEPTQGSTRRQPIAAFAILTHDLFSSRKIRRAGAFGALVFVFALLRNAARGRKGCFPAADIDPWYLGDQLQISEADAKQGLQSAIAAGLLAIEGEGDTALVVGWDEEWARRSLSESEARQLRRLRSGSEVETETKSERKTKKREDTDKRREEKRSPDSARTVSGQDVCGPLSPPVSKEERALAMQIVRALHEYTQAKHIESSEVGAVVGLLRKGYSAAHLVALAEFTADDGGLAWYSRRDADGLHNMRGHLNVSMVFGEKHVKKHLANAVSVDAWTKHGPNAAVIWGDQTAGIS